MAEISIIIPTLNRAKTLELTLNSIIEQTDLNGVEVIVVDNGSTDGTAELCKNYIIQHKFLLQYYYDDEPGLLTGRHLGASKATGSILCFLDDDVVLSSTWLDGVRNAFNNKEIKLATGPSVPQYEAEPPHWLEYFFKEIKDGGNTCEWLSLLDLGNEKKVINPTTVWGLNFCIRKDEFKDLGGFHPDNLPAHLQMYQGDGETGLTLKAFYKKYKAIYHPQIKVKHIISSERLTEAYFKKRAFYQGVCNSYTLLRKQHLETKEAGVIDNVKNFLRPIKNLVSTKKQAFPKDIIALKGNLDEEEKNGFNFHQKAFNENENIKVWVLKKDYWDYKLPR